MYEAFLSIVEAAHWKTLAGYRTAVAAEVDQTAAAVRNALTEDGQPLTRERLGRYLFRAFDLRPVSVGTAPVALLCRRDYALTVAAVVQVAAGLPGKDVSGELEILKGLDGFDLEPDPPPLTAGEVAELLRISASTVRRRSDTGDLDARRTKGRHRRITPAAVNELISQQHDKGGA